MKLLEIKKVTIYNQFLGCDVAVFDNSIDIYVKGLNRYCSAMVNLSTPEFVNNVGVILEFEDRQIRMNLLEFTTLLNLTK